MKKRSDAKSREERLESIHLLLDETIAGKSILAGLAENNIPAIPLGEIAPRGADDTEVLDALLNKPGLFLLTRDRDFRYHPAVRQRILDAGVGAFVITSSGNKTGAQIVALITSAWPRIQKFAQKNNRPFVAKVTSEGRVELHR